jgi:hypothetical protein
MSPYCQNTINLTILSRALSSEKSYKNDKCVLKLQTCIIVFMYYPQTYYPQLCFDWSKWMSYKNDEYVSEHPKTWRHLYILNSADPDW